MKPCVKCGKPLRRKNEEHDCKEIRKRMGRGVSAEVERLKQRNEQGLKALGAPGVKADPRALGMPGSSIVE